MSRAQVKTLKFYLISIKSVLLGLAVTAIWTPGTAFAQQQVTLQVSGLIPAACAFDQSEVGSAAQVPEVFFDIDPDDPAWASQSRKVQFALSCNTPFTLAARSASGGLQNVAALTGAIGGNFSNEIAYELAVKVQTEEASAPVSFACQSRDMAASTSSCSASSGFNTAIGDGAGIGELEVTLSDNVGFPTQGRYQDTIVLALAFQ